jgi:hypothetical protein
MTTTYPPIPSEMGTFCAQLGAIDVMNQYRARTLPETMRRFVDLTIDQCRLQGDDAQRWVDGVVALTVREWAAAQAAGDADEEARSMMVASCSLAALMLQSLEATRS